VVEAANAHLKTDPLHDHAEPLMGGRFWVMPNGLVAFSEKPPVEVTATPTEASGATVETIPETPTPPESVPETVPTPEPTPAKETVLVEAPSKKLPPISALREAADAAGIDITDLGVTKEDKREIQKRLQEHENKPKPEPKPEPKKMVKTSVALTPAQMIEVVEDTGPSLSEIASGNIPEKVVPEVVEEPPKDKGPSLQDIIAASAKVKPEEVRPPKGHDPDSLVDDLVPEDSPVFDDEGDDLLVTEEETPEEEDGDLDSLVDGILDGDRKDSLEEIEKREDAALDDLF
jgi:hypothetical protein